jgi:hypothetical protein
VAWDIGAVITQFEIKYMHLQLTGMILLT